MKIWVGSGFVESSTDFGGDSKILHQGVRQGNIAGPAPCIIFSLFLIKMKLKSEVTSTISLETFSFLGFAFVYDTGLVVVGNHNDTKLDIVSKLQNIIVTLQECLQVSGGMLRPEKCY